MYRIFIYISFFIFFVILSSCNELATNQTPEGIVSQDYLIAGGEDECQNELVVINYNNKIIYTGIKNYITPDGDCLAKRILECLRESKNHGQFVSCMAHLTNQWRKAGIITNEEKGEIMVWAAQSDIP